MIKWICAGMMVCFAALVNAEEAKPAPAKKQPKSFTKEQFVAMEKVKWEKHGWNWNQAKVEANFDEMDVNKDGLADGKERKDWYAKKMAEKAAQ